MGGLSKMGKWVEPEELLALIENKGYVIWEREPVDAHVVLHARSPDFTDTKFVRAKVPICDLNLFFDD